MESSHRDFRNGAPWGSCLERKREFSAIMSDLGEAYMRGEKIERIRDIVCSSTSDCESAT